MKIEEITSFKLEEERKGMSTGKLFHDVLNVILSIINITVYYRILLYALSIDELPLEQFIFMILGMIYLGICLESFKLNTLNSIKYV